MTPTTHQSILDLDRAARKAGKSYGKYVADVERPRPKPKKKRTCKRGDNP